MGNLTDEENQKTVAEVMAAIKDLFEALKPVTTDPEKFLLTCVASAANRWPPEYNFSKFVPGLHVVNDETDSKK